MKITKDAADYEEHTDSLSRRCGTCSMFRPPMACTLVRGEIRADAVCKYWEPKRANG